MVEQIEGVILLLVRYGVTGALVVTNAVTLYLLLDAKKRIREVENREVAFLREAFRAEQVARLNPRKRRTGR